MFAAMLTLNFRVYQVGNKVGLSLEFSCPDLACARALATQLQIKAEAAKLLSTLGFDTSELDGMIEVSHYEYQE